MNEKYYNTKESVAEYIELAKDVNGANLIAKLMKVLPSDSNILEIGSGPGSDLAILKETYNVTGSDNSLEFLKHLNSKFPNGEFLELDAVTLKSDKKFDGIYSNKVLHHLKLSELTASIKRQSQVLNENGIICHSFWKGEGTEVFKGMFVQYHDEKSLRGYFETYFDIISITDYKEFEENDSVLLIAKKKQ